MCIAIPGKIVEIKGKKAVIDYGTEKREARILEDKYKVGDYVIVQLRTVVQKLDEDVAKKALEIWNEA
ncbi:MAG: HypC/HybG/HupF family hydrogenase formation chaperone [Candidatus Woesearchaeota archaeon]